MHFIALGIILLVILVGLIHAIAATKATDQFERGLGSCALGAGLALLGMFELKLLNHQTGSYNDTSSLQRYVFVPVIVIGVFTGLYGYYTMLANEDNPTKSVN